MHASWIVVIIYMNYSDGKMHRWCQHLASGFSLQYHPWITHKGHENKGNDHQQEKLLIVKWILLVSSIGMYGGQCRGYAYWCLGVKGQVLLW